MYESFFSLTRRPFTAVPEAERYFPATEMEAARQRVLRAVERGEGPALIIGPSGCGKTQLLAVLAAEFNDAMDVVTLTAAHLESARELLQSILHGLGLPFRNQEEGELRLTLIDHLRPTVERCRELLLLVDEAQSISPRLLEELRLLINVVQDGRPRVHLVLAGLPELEECLDQPELVPLQQRLACRVYLHPLSCDDAVHMIRSQLAAAGNAAPDWFATDAMEGAWELTDGVPRQLNQLCDHALVLAAAAGQSEIDRTLIDEAWADLQQLPAPKPRLADLDELPATLEFDNRSAADHREGDSTDCETACEFEVARQTHDLDPFAQPPAETQDPHRAPVISEVDTISGRLDEIDDQLAIVQEHDEVVSPPAAAAADSPAALEPSDVWPAAESYTFDVNVDEVPADSFFNNDQVTVAETVEHSSPGEPSAEMPASSDSQGSSSPWGDEFVEEIRVTDPYNEHSNQPVAAAANQPAATAEMQFELEPLPLIVQHGESPAGDQDPVFPERESPEEVQIVAAGPPALCLDSTTAVDEPVGQFDGQLDIAPLEEADLIADSAGETATETQDYLVESVQPNQHMPLAVPVPKSSQAEPSPVETVPERHQQHRPSRADKGKAGKQFSGLFSKMRRT